MNKNATVQNENQTKAATVKVAMPEDRAVWVEGKLVYDSWNEYREGDPHQQETFEKCEPTADFCYWCAVGGKCYALKTSSFEGGCIAATESAIRATGATRNEGYGLGSVY